MTLQALVRFGTLFVLGWLSLAPAGATVVFFRGKVTMEDGSPPGVTVAIERSCYGMQNRIEVIADKSGQYVWRTDVDPFAAVTLAQCTLIATRTGYTSTSIDLTDPRLSSNPQLPTLILIARGNDPALAITEMSVPRKAQKDWDLGMKLLIERRYADAEKLMESVTMAAPKFAPGWTALGMVLENTSQPEGARRAYEKAIALDSKPPLPYFRLTRIQMDAKEWDQAAKTSETLLKLDSRRRYPSALIDNAIIRYHLKDLDGAQATLNTAISLDKKHEFPRTEYVLGMILEARKEYTAAADHMKEYLKLDPKAFDAPSVTARLENLGRPESIDIAKELDSTLPAQTVSEETWVPGGMKAFATVAHMQGSFTYGNFFQEYCRTLVRESAPANQDAVPDYAATIAAFIVSVSELTKLAEQKGDVNVITLSLRSEPQRQIAQKILPLLGWKLVQQGGSYSVEPGDRPTDVLRQPVPAALGIDEITMQEALEAGNIFSFEIASDTARLENAGAWSEFLKASPAYPGGMIEWFARDVRMARTYAGLGAMSKEASAALLKGMGLRALVAQSANILSLYSEVLAVNKGNVVLPGGADSHLAWQRLVGASPFDAPAFFRSLLEKEHGALAAFYSFIAKSDAAHQRFFTASADRTERFYNWYKRSGENFMGVDRLVGGWRSSIFRDLPLDAAGHVRFPGGKKAWGDATDDSLLDLPALEALVPIAQLEEKRKSPIDEATATMLAAHYSEWKNLIPYFESLPGLGHAEFESLEAFSNTASNAKTAIRNPLLGEWHSLVNLIILGSKAGTLNPSQAAGLFLRICNALAAPDHSVQALNLLRETVAIASGATIGTPAIDLDEAIPGSLLKLNGQRREAFDRVRELQQAPRIASLTATTDPGKTAAALSGLVYAALLDPQQLLVSEDPSLLSKHRFLVDADLRRVPLFPVTALVSSSLSPGSYLSGGFGGFDNVVRSLARGGKGVRHATSEAASERTPPVVSMGPADNSGLSASDTLFRATGRLVEVYATVKDDRGHYVDDLPASTFTVTEAGKPLQTVAFETRTGPVSVALLFDTTGSMQAALPALRNAALKLIGDLRPIDSVAVYSFNDTVTELQSFTTNKSEAKRAVMRTHASGPTALYDALVRVNLDLAGRTGKKVIVVFTDGADNTSVLTTDNAMLRAKSSGIPIYTIAQGSALNSPVLLKQLSTVSKATGGVAFAIHGPAEIREVFETVSEDLMHGYLITFQPPSAEGHNFHPIDVTLSGAKGRKVRAREGYYPD